MSKQYAKLACGFDVFKCKYIKLNNQITIVAWDVGGGCKVRQLFHHYYDDCEVLIWIVDSTD